MDPCEESRYCVDGEKLKYIKGTDITLMGMELTWFYFQNRKNTRESLLTLSLQLPVLPDCRAHRGSLSTGSWNKLSPINHYYLE